MQTSNLLKLRKQWFKLKTKEFIERYAAGLMVLIVFLPGVAIGDNFNMLASAVSTPFVLLALTTTSFAIKAAWLMLLSVIFLVWSRAQTTAITGGAFAEFMQSLPLSEKHKNRNNIRLLLSSNHFLWFFVLSGLYFLTKKPETGAIHYFNYTYLLVLLITCQFVSIFKPNKSNTLILIILSLFFIMPLSGLFAWLKIASLFVATALFIRSLFSIKDKVINSQQNQKISILPPVISQNLYLQMLLKSGLSSSLFRFGIIAGLVFAFTLVARHFSGLNDNDLTPYAYVLEALLAYYLSGFYVFFKDERRSMHTLFATLPVKASFWLLRDIFTVVSITTLLHGLYFFWAKDQFPFERIQNLFLFHILLLLICYPLRTVVKNKQTFISFVVLFIITAITLFNLT